jgi:mono/diheme cytochrome c family protein
MPSLFPSNGGGLFPPCRHLSHRIASSLAKAGTAIQLRNRHGWASETPDMPAFVPMLDLAQHHIRGGGRWLNQLEVSERPSYMRNNLNWIPRRLIAVASLVIAVAGLAANSALAADPDKGETLVKRWCADCHLVAADQKAATTDAPSFASIAKRPGFDPGKVEFFLRDPHPKMPNMTLGRVESADIAAYIATLR